MKIKWQCLYDFIWLFIFEAEFFLCDLTTFLKIHQIHVYWMILQSKCCEKTLIRTCHTKKDFMRNILLRYPKYFVLRMTLMFLTKVYHMSWFIHWFLQVPNIKSFTLINRKELAHSCCKFDIIAIFHIWWVFLSRGWTCIWCVVVLKIKITPLNLSNWIFTSWVPYSYWRCKTFIIHSKINI